MTNGGLPGTVVGAAPGTLLGAIRLRVGIVAHLFEFLLPGEFRFVFLLEDFEANFFVDFSGAVFAIVFEFFAMFGELIGAGGLVAEGSGARVRWWFSVHSRMSGTAA